MSLVFVDLETGGLDPYSHPIIEVGALVEPEGKVIHFSLPVDLGRCAISALQVNRYVERYDDLVEIERDPEEGAAEIAEALEGNVLVANNAVFEAAFLREFLSSHSFELGWHYRPVDTGALVAAKYGIAPPWSTRKLLAEAGLSVEGLGVPLEERHTALADAKLCKAMYEHVLGKVT